MKEQTIKTSKPKVISAAAESIDYITVKGVKYYNYQTASAKLKGSRPKAAGRWEPYEGKFGEGYILITPRYDTSVFINVTYFLPRKTIYERAKQELKPRRKLFI